jgi:hypothetical protein
MIKTLNGLIRQAKRVDRIVTLWHPENEVPTYTLAFSLDGRAVNGFIQVPDLDQANAAILASKLAGVRYLWLESSQARARNFNYGRETN